MVCLPLLFPRRLAVVLPLLTLTPLGFLLLLDLLKPPLVWFVPLALPILLSIEVFGGLASLATALTKRRGLNVIAYALMAAAGVCIAVESALAWFLHQPWRLAWSSVVAFAAIPVAGFLIYFHHRIAKTTTLRKLFHL